MLRYCQTPAALWLLRSLADLPRGVMAVGLGSYQPGGNAARGSVAVTGSRRSGPVTSTGPGQRHTVSSARKSFLRHFAAEALSALI